jgi:hypothetical protein
MVTASTQTSGHMLDKYDKAHYKNEPKVNIRSNSQEYVVGRQGKKLVGQTQTAEFGNYVNEKMIEIVLKGTPKI